MTSIVIQPTRRGYALFFFLATGFSGSTCLAGIVTARRVNAEIRHLDNLSDEEAEKLSGHEIEDRTRGCVNSRELKEGEVARKRLVALRNTKVWLYRTLYVLACLTAAMFIFASTAIVGTKKVGILLSFNKPVGTLSNGLHLKAPWQKVDELDAAIQTDSHVGARKGAITIRLSGQQTAYVDTSVRWRLRPGRADELYRDYRDFSKIRDSLVTRELKAATNEAFKSYDPLTTLKPGATQLTPGKLGDDVAAKLRLRVGSQVEILNVIIPFVGYDEKTQARLNDFQQEIAATRVAEQKEKTAEATARANRKLASSVSRDPNVIVSRCVDVLADLARDGKGLPAGFSCWPGRSDVAVAVR